jgi:RNA polymerase sigma factor (TIGR02999 family)
MSEDPVVDSSSQESSLPAEAKKLLPQVYDDLRHLAARRLAREGAAQSLDATGLVHEAYLRLAAQGDAFPWANRAHFFAAAAEAMRRILVERARRRKRLKRGGDLQRVELDDSIQPVADEPCAEWEQLLQLDNALTRFRLVDPVAAEITSLHFFAGVPLAEVAEMLGMSRAAAYRQWAYARSWLKMAMDEPQGEASPIRPRSRRADAAAPDTD